jgi:hypothetical protein
MHCSGTLSTALSTAYWNVGLAPRKDMVSNTQDRVKWCKQQQQRECNADINSATSSHLNAHAVPTPCGCQTGRSQGRP